MGSHPADYILDFHDFDAFVDENAFVPHANCFIPGHYEDQSSSSGPTTTQNKVKHSSDLGAFSHKLLPPSNNPYCRNIDKIDLGTQLPEEFSWRDRGILGMPRDQAACGSCWAQAAGKAITSQLSLHYNRYVEASVQQIVDCTWEWAENFTNKACMGGNSYSAYRQFHNMGINISTEEEYPYLGIGGQCSSYRNVNPDVEYRIKTGVGRVIGCLQFTTESSSYEDKKNLIKAALYKYGPLVVLIKVTGSEFGILGSQVYDDKHCMPDASSGTNHAVTLSGWTKDAWEIQNSWSDLWGDKGYGYISYNHDCGISEEPIVPLLEFDD